MSGGHFNDCGHEYHKVYHQFADELEQEIRQNGKAGTDGDHSNGWPNHSDEVIEYLKEQVPKMRKIAEIMRHNSGDHGDDTFMEQVKEVKAQ